MFKSSERYQQMSYNTILVDQTEAVCTITLNRPDKLNSFNREMHLELVQALDVIEADDQTRVLVITGTGRAFCCGQDLNERSFDSETEIDLGDALGKFYNPLVQRIRDMPIPVIMAINGVAAGAGANFGLSGDIVLAARSAKFIQAFSRIGLIPDAGGTYILAQKLGEMRAKALAMLAVPLEAEKAEQWGLVWEVYDDKIFMNEVMKLAKTMSKQATQALALTKQAIHSVSTNSYAEQLELERTLQALAGKTEDYREGVAAFLEKRDAVFKGK